MRRLYAKIGICFLLLSSVYAVNDVSAHTCALYLTPGVHAQSSVVLSNDSNQRQDYDVRVYRVYNPGTPIALRKEITSPQNADITTSLRSFSLAAKTQEKLDVAFLRKQVTESMSYEIDISASPRRHSTFSLPLAWRKTAILPTQKVHVFVEPAEKHPALTALPVGNDLRISNIGNLAITLQNSIWCTQLPSCRSVADLGSVTLYPGNSVYIAHISQETLFKATQVWGGKNGKVFLTPFLHNVYG